MTSECRSHAKVEYLTSKCYCLTKRIILTNFEIRNDLPEGTFIPKRDVVNGRWGTMVEVGEYFVGEIFITTVP